MSRIQVSSSSNFTTNWPSLSSDLDLLELVSYAMIISGGWWESDKTSSSEKVLLADFLHWMN